MRFEYYQLPGCRLNTPLVLDTCRQGQEQYLLLQVAQDERLIEQQKLPIQEMNCLRLLLQVHPETCEAAALVAALQGESLEDCLDLQRHSGKVRPKDADLIPVRNILSRARKKLRRFGVDIVPLPRHGWRLCPFPVRSSVPPERFGRIDKEPPLVPGALWLDHDLHVLLWVEHERVREVQQFSLTAWYFLVKMLECYPDYTPYELLLSMQTGRSLATCQRWLAQAIEQRQVNKLLHATRYTLLRCARPVRKFGLDIRAVMNLGYELIPVPSLSERGEEGAAGERWEAEPEGNKALVERA